MSSLTKPVSGKTGSREGGDEADGGLPTGGGGQELLLHVRALSSSLLELVGGWWGSVWSENPGRE